MYNAEEFMSTVPPGVVEAIAGLPYEVMAAFPQRQGYVSVSIPTWHFSSEPPMPFATYIVTLGYPSPMVFVGHEFWTKTMPVYPLIERLIAVGRYKNLNVSLVETSDEIILELEGGK